MNIKEELLRERSKRQTEKIAQTIGTDQKLFEELIKLMLANESPLNQRAAWVLGKCADYDTNQFTPHLYTLVSALKTKDEGIKRNILRALQKIELPENLLGKTADHCFNFLESKAEPIAVKVFAMTVLCNICQSIPELTNELKLIIEDQLPYSSSGFKSRAKKVLKRL